MMAPPDATATEVSKRQEEHSFEVQRKVGDHARQLMIGGLAAVWVLKQDAGAAAMPLELAVSSLCLILALSVDLFHGLLLSAIIWQVAQYNASLVDPRSWETRFALWMNRTNSAGWFFIAKTVLMALAYVLLVHYAVLAVTVA